MGGRTLYSFIWKSFTYYIIMIPQIKFYVFSYTTNWALTKKQHSICTKLFGEFGNVRNLYNYTYIFIKTLYYGDSDNYDLC